MLKEFKQFVMRGNVIDMAVGIIIGAAFGAIVKSLVSDIIMPPIGLLLGKVDFNNLFIVIKGGADVPGPYATLADAQAAGAVTLNWGLFVNSVIAFLILAFVIFLIIKQVNRLKREKPAPPAEPTEKDCPYCLTRIPIKARRCPNCTSQLEVS
jgi:large conductance mechanosensitive channel